MRVLKAKGTRSAKKFGVKIPMELAQKIESLDKEVKDKGYQIDWSEPCVEVLTKLAQAVEADLKDIDKADTE